MTSTGHPSAGMLTLACGASAVRAEAKLDQVVCMLEGMASLLGETPGDLAVVIHGDRDCLGVLVQGMEHPGTERFFGTQLGEPEAVAGQGGDRLRECLEAVCAELRPQAVFLLGTCLSALLGEEIEAAALDVGSRTGVNVIPVGGAGMGFVHQAEILDRHACLLLEAAARPPARGMDPGSSAGLCLVGFDPGPEVLGQMARLGVEVHAVLGPGAPLSAWQLLPGARAHCVLDPAIYPRLTATLRERYGQEGLVVPFPVGSRATEELFDIVLGASPAPDAAREILAPLAEAARRAVAEARPRCAGARLGYNLGSKKNLDPRTLSLAGLTDLPAFDELGFEPVLLVQGDDATRRMEALSQTLLGLGFEAPVRVFSDTVFFGELCREVGCDLVYASDHLREQAAAAGVGFLSQGELEPGFGQVAENIRRITGALDGKP